MGKEQTLQEGFDKGYADGALKGFRSGVLMGLLRYVFDFCARIMNDDNRWTQVVWISISGRTVHLRSPIAAS